MKREEKIYPVADAETLIGFRRGAKVLKAKVGEKGRDRDRDDDPILWDPLPLPDEA